MAASFWPAMKACAAGPGSRFTIFTSFTPSPFFLRNQASVKYGAVPGAEAATVLPRRSEILPMSLRTTMPSAPYDLSSWTTWRVATPLAFQTIHVSTVVAAHATSPEAIARWRSFCGMNLIVASTPFFLKRPAFSASVSGANPVHPLIAIVTFGSCARTGTTIATTSASSTAVTQVLLTMDQASIGDGGPQHEGTPHTPLYGQPILAAACYGAAHGRDDVSGVETPQRERVVGGPHRVRRPHRRGRTIRAWDCPRRAGRASLRGPSGRPRVVHPRERGVRGREALKDGGVTPP